MAVDLSAVHTLVDIAKLYAGKDILPFVELLHKRNGVLGALSYELANQFTSHRYSKEVYLPDAVERAIGEGATDQKSQEDNGEESLSYIQGKSKIDIQWQAIMGAKFNEYRYKKDMQASEGFGQGVATRIFYGAGTPGKIRGLNVRYATSASTNVKLAGGAVAVSNTSLYVCQPGDGTFNLLCGEGARPNSPQGEFSTGVLNMRDLDIRTIITSTTTLASYEAFVTLFEAMFGICVYDDRAVQRLCNINTTTGAGEVDPDQVWWMIKSLPNPDGPKVIFANRQGIYQFQKNIQNKALFTTAPNNYGGVDDYFMGARLILTEAITNVEAVVS
jgi:hypothetical protein